MFRLDKPVICVTKLLKHAILVQFLGMWTKRAIAHLNNI